MLGQFRRYVDLAAIGMIDADSPGMEVHFPADRAGQERVLAAIFTVPHDRVSDCRHMHAKLVRASGIGLQFDPAGAVSGALYNARSEERRVGKECVSTCRSRWSPYH